MPNNQPTYAQEFGRVRKDDNTDIVVRTGCYLGNDYIDIREFLTGDPYEGYTKKGIRIPLKLYCQVKNILDQI